jgi:hypothetical protein
MPDGFVFITKVSGPEVKDGKAFADVTIDERELVMCRSCRHYNTACCSEGCGWCESRNVGTWDEWYCADGEAGTYEDA